MRIDVLGDNHSTKFLHLATTDGVLVGGVQAAHQQVSLLLFPFHVIQNCKEMECLKTTSENITSSNYDIVKIVTDLAGVMCSLCTGQYTQWSSSAPGMPMDPLWPSMQP